MHRRGSKHRSGSGSELSGWAGWDNWWTWLSARFAIQTARTLDWRRIPCRTYTGRHKSACSGNGSRWPSWSWCSLTILQVPGPLRVTPSLWCWCSTPTNKARMTTLLLTPGPSQCLKIVIEAHCEEGFLAKRCCLWTQRLDSRELLCARTFFMFFSCLLTQHSFCRAWIKEWLQLSVYLENTSRKANRYFKVWLIQ